MHGYAMMEDIERFGAGTLYGASARLEGRAWWRRCRLQVADSRIA